MFALLFITELVAADGSSFPIPHTCMRAVLLIHAYYTSLLRCVLLAWCTNFCASSSRHLLFWQILCWFACWADQCFECNAWLKLWPNQRERVASAYRAMANLGIHESKVKPVLKKLLKLYDKNWELIEEESYRALADAVFEEDENKVLGLDQNSESKKVDDRVVDDEAHMHDGPLRPLKRLRLRGQDVHSSRPLTSCGPSSASFPLKTPKLEDDTMPDSSRLQPQSTTALSDGNARIETCEVPPRDATVDKGKKPVSPEVTPRGRRFISDGTHTPGPLKEPTVEPGTSLLLKNKIPHPFTLIIPKDEPIDDMPDYEIPIAVIHPVTFLSWSTFVESNNKYCICPTFSFVLMSFVLIPPKEQSNGRDSPMNGAAGKQDGHDMVALHYRDVDVEGEDILLSSNEEATSDVDLVLSSVGEVKISELQLKICVICLLKFRTDSNNNSQEGFVKTAQTVDVSNEFKTNGSPIVRSSALQAPQVKNSLPCLSDLDDAALVSKKVGMNDFLESDGGKELEDPISPNSRTLVVPKSQLTTDNIMAVHDINDLTKGEERVKISLVNNTTNDFLPPFHYIPRNLVFRDASVNISLSCIGNEDCCSTCKGNCLLSSKPCICTNKTGGKFAYTAQGLLKEDFLEECIAISREPQNYFYCKNCPLERSKNDDCSEPCKGHLTRKFIKECWSKCGCGKHCGNRIVQRGITCNLQVFLTSDGKGWGLRTLEDLPKGAFVCEFVGEILTVKELHERNLKYPKNGKYTNPILLDADWDSGVVKDREALCLYAASYGNAARFINHRCLDANLIEIPVEIEGPAHHYYHFAFFTSRKIAAQEELTWVRGLFLTMASTLMTMISLLSCSIADVAVNSAGILSDQIDPLDRQLHDGHSLLNRFAVRCMPSISLNKFQPTQFVSSIFHCFALG
ncbi:hypothetical protein VNO77_17458 [Canavalia gladiata]|uniref:Uncharacterized protein n=1 Tax=Canavalia gladiata TaxID=3824 RepID=A0AAN9QGM8_CANGL